MSLIHGPSSLVLGVQEEECVALGLVFLPQVGMEVVEVEGHRSLVLWWCVL